MYVHPSACLISKSDCPVAICCDKSTAVGEYCFVPRQSNSTPTVDVKEVQGKSVTFLEKRLKKN